MSIGVHRLNRVPTKKIRFKGQKKKKRKQKTLTEKSHTVNKDYFSNSYALLL